MSGENGDEKRSGESRRMKTKGITLRNSESDRNKNLRDCLISVTSAGARSSRFAAFPTPRQGACSGEEIKHASVRFREPQRRPTKEAQMSLAAVRIVKKRGIYEWIKK